MSRSTFSPVVHRLPSGVRIVIDPVPFVDSAAIGLWVRAGTRDEPRGKAGVAHLVEHTSFRRTRTRSSRMIARDFENVGAYANAYTTKEETCYYVRSLSDHFPRVLSTLMDIVLHPVFDAADINREREVIAEEIRAYEDEAEEYIFDVAEQHLFGQHPLGMPIVGTLESLQHITTADVRAFHREHYHAGSLVVTVSGNVDTHAFIDAVASGLQRVKPRRAPHRRSKPRLTTPTQQRLPWHSQQTHVLWYRTTDGYKLPSRAALTLLNVILGDGMSSRLNVRIRESHSIAYSVYSQLQQFNDVGMLAIYAGMDGRNIGRTERMLDTELSKLHRDGIRASELQRAKEQVRATRIMSLESMSSRMSLLGKGMLDEGRPEDPFRAIEEIRAVDLDEMQALCRSICNPSEWHRLVLAPSGLEAQQQER